MIFADYFVTEITPELPEIFIIRVTPKNTNKIFSFKPGQYCCIKIPSYEKSKDIHTFSIASSPLTKDYLEFCIKVYGNWTKTLSQMQIGDTLGIAGPFGEFTWEKDTDSNAVFLIGGVGISPVISMLRYMHTKQYQGNFLLIYGNRTPNTIAYKEELKKLKGEIRQVQVVDIFSHLQPNDPWSGYRGFVTAEILEKVVNFSLQPTYFVIGPPVFIEKMNRILKNFGVEESKIKQEVIGQ